MPTTKSSGSSRIPLVEWKLLIKTTNKIAKKNQLQYLNAVKQDQELIDLHFNGNPFYIVKDSKSKLHMDNMRPINSTDPIDRIYD